jgi:hypothetical protein
MHEILFKRIQFCIMTKRFLFFLFILSASFGAVAQKNNSFYLYTPKDFPNEVQSDLIDLLKNATGKKWQIALSETEVNPGILLKISENNLFKTKESFHLQSNGSSLLAISSVSIDGLIFGIYKHLRSLGFRFYLPDELYTITPSVQNPFGSKKDIIDQPFAQVRNFAGTGGFGSGNADTDKSVERSWNLWKLRNGFGSAYYLSGHRGEDFILSNKQTLKKHPEWLVTPLTGDDYKDMTIKLNYLNKQAVDFYTDWTIEPFTRKEYKLPPKNISDFQSIEPSDGGGFINALSPGKKLPSPSEQVYAAANLAAQKLDKLFPDRPNIGVNVYAYSSHAEPPTFPLHPRVFVQLVPYQFQNVAYGPSFIKLWSSKAKRFGIYDYFNYADAQYDLPGGNTLEETMLRLIQSTKSGSEGTSYETSYSKFATGVPLWVIGRYLVDGDANWKKNLEQFADDLYKNGSSFIKDLFSLFYLKGSFSPDQLWNASDLVAKASSVGGDETYKKRILELKEYLYYIHLVFQSRNESNGSLTERQLPVLQYAWKLYETKIIHSYRIMQLVCYGFLNMRQSDPNYKQYYQTHLEWFPETERSKTAWSKIPQYISPQEVEKNFQLVKSKYPKTESYAAFDMNDIWKVLEPNYKPKKEFVFSGNSTQRAYFNIAAKKPTLVKIKYRLTTIPDYARITLSGIDKNYTSPIAYMLTEKEGEFTFTIPAGENRFFVHASDYVTYRMQVTIDDGLIYFPGSPRMIMAFYKKFTDTDAQWTYDPGYFPSYIFIPANITSVLYKVQLNSLAISSPSGRTYTSKMLLQEHGGYETRQFNFPKDESGKIWKAVISGNYNYNMINIPDRYFLLEPKK